jgi:hypothetical protein
MKPDRSEPTMSDRRERIAAAIQTFVEHPVTNLVKGIVLIVIGLTEAARTFREDLAHGRLRVGHGLVIIGIFSTLEALPELIEGLEASRRYLESKAQEDRNQESGDKP